MIVVLGDREQTQEVQMAQHFDHFLPALPQRPAEFARDAAQRHERGLRRRVFAEAHEELDGIVGALRIDVLRRDAGELGEEVHERVESVLH